MRAAITVAAAPAVSHAATMSTVYASPAGSGTDCSAAVPCSLTQARTAVRALTGAMTGDVVVQLAGDVVVQLPGGVYRLAAPLTLGAADSGANGYRVIWQAAPGSTPVLSGGWPGCRTSSCCCSRRRARPGQLDHLRLPRLSTRPRQRVPTVTCTLR
jgi:hypothetical protein